VPEEKLERGDRVRLLSLPTGYMSGELPLTVGNIYIVHYLNGSNVCTTSDDPEIDGDFNIGRVEKVTD
jgi:hypothetical protein